MKTRNAARGNTFLQGLLVVLLLSGCQSIGALQDEIAREAARLVEGLRPEVTPGARAAPDSRTLRTAGPATISPQRESNSSPAGLSGNADHPETIPRGAPPPYATMPLMSDHDAPETAAPAKDWVDPPTPNRALTSPPIAPHSAPSSESPCGTQIPLGGCTDVPYPVPDPKEDLRLVIASLNPPSSSGEPIELLLQTTIPKSVNGDLILRIVGTSGEKALLRKKIPLRKPYRSEYAVHVTAPLRAQDKQRVHLVAELVDAGGKQLAVAKRDFILAGLGRAACCTSAPDATTGRREQIAADLTRRARDACGNPKSFEQHVSTLGNEPAALVADTITRMTKALNAYSAIREKAANDRDTYEDYRRYLAEFSDSPCEPMATRGTTVAFWVSRNSGSSQVLSQLDAAIVASKNSAEIAMGETHFQLLRNQGNPYARLREAKRLYGAGRVQAAETLLLDLEKTAPSSKVFEYLGHVNAADCKKSSSYFSRAIAFDASCAACYFHLAECLDTFGRHREASEGFRKTLELTQGHKDSHSIRYRERSKQRLGIH